jgi:hypothetical protein
MAIDAMPEDDMTELPPEEGEMEDKSSVFLSKSALGGKQCKPGDTLTFKVQDVDPETGDVEAVMEGYSHKNGESEGYSEAFDRAMPEEEGMV